MNPDERHLLEKALRLSAENNAILRRLDRRARWAMLWSLLKVAIIVIPLIVGYLYLAPYFQKISSEYSNIQQFINNIHS